MWNALPVPIHISKAQTIVPFRKLHKSHLFDPAFPPFVSRLPVDKPVLTWIMTYDYYMSPSELEAL